MPERQEVDADAGIEDFQEYARTILGRSVVVLLIAVLLGWAHDGAVARGLALGGAFSLLKFRLRVNHLMRLHPGASAKSFRRAWMHSLGLYVLTGVILAVAAVRPSLHLAAVVAGIFLTNAVIAAERLVPWLRVEYRSPLDVAP